ncbi:hypothetical protein BDZ88DRAFT_432045 [Geranomyces variabilis]|nr:hypothetical protein BDZ88DRAFT_432045 [Geranomyces variabilis]
MLLRSHGECWQRRAQISLTDQLCTTTRAWLKAGRNLLCGLCRTLSDLRSLVETSMRRHGAPGLSPLTCIRSTLDNPNAYGVKRPDYHIKEPLNGIGLSNWEIKSPWATETHKIEDIARVILSAITKVKADLSRNTPAGSPVKICLALSSNEASVFELTLHEGVFLAVEVGVWVIPTALQATQEGVGSQTRRYQPRLPGRARSSILPPETPGHAQ